MEDKEYLVLKFLSRFEAPIPFNDLEKGLKDHFDKHKKDGLLTCVGNLEYRGLLEDNYVKGIQITEKGKKQLEAGELTDDDEITPRKRKSRRKQDHDQEASSFVYRTYWLMFAISIISFVLALLSFLFWFFPGLRHTLFP